MNEETNRPTLIEDEALDDANGGLLLPAVQKVREAAARMKCANATDNGATAE